jgi:tRNA uridine 5-carboxymethylaminomethyl modification enzyme
MFTSRAEFRTLLRQDNADLRLTELSYRLGLASQERMQHTIDKNNGVIAIRSILNQFSLEPDETANYLLEKNTTPLTQKQKATQVLLRPNIDLRSMANAIPRLGHALQPYTPEMLEQSEIQVKYEVYIGKEKELVAKMAQLEDLLIPDNFNYDKLSSLSNEALQKFKKIKPRTLGQASRISGVNPSDVQILMVFMGR